MSEIQIGKINKLKVVKEVPFGLYLEGGNYGEILLPKKYIPEDSKIGDLIDVIVYFDSKDCIIATTEKPYAYVGDFAYLQVKSVTSIGAFLDWGLVKDLFVPFREQKERLQKDKYYPFYIYFDIKSNRIAATTRLLKFLSNDPSNYKLNEAVDLFIFREHEIGFQAVINNSHEGLLYKNEIFQPLKLGQYLKGFIKKIRDDGKIDLCLEKPGYEKVDGLAKTILQKIEEQGGSLNITDKSSSDIIHSVFHISKKSYKKAIGSLYKQRLITIDSNCIKLTKKARHK